MTDFTKLPQSEWHKVRTRDGREVRILCTDAGHRAPIVGLVGGITLQWYPTGAVFGLQDAFDLILPPEPRVVWLRDYGRHINVGVYLDRPTIDLAFTDYRIDLTDPDKPTIGRVE